MNRYIFTTILVLILCSCDKKKDIKSDMDRVYHSTINFSSDSMSQYMYNNVDIAYFHNNAPTLVIYFDSLICGTCEVKNLHLWNDLLSQLNSSHNLKDFKTIFVFTPSQRQIIPLKLSLRNVQLDYPIFIDEEYLFISKNANIPNNHIMHVFLLDDKNKVILVGNILNNEHVRDLFVNFLSL